MADYGCLVGQFRVRVCGQGLRHRLNDGPVRDARKDTCNTNKCVHDEPIK